MGKLKRMVVVVLMVDGILSPRKQATISDDFILKQPRGGVQSSELARHSWATVARVKRKEKISPWTSALSIGKERQLCHCLLCSLAPIEIYYVHNFEGLIHIRYRTSPDIFQQLVAVRSWHRFVIQCVYSPTSTPNSFAT